jgi:hypothetical protein
MPKWPEWPDKPNISWLSYGMYEECRRKWFLYYSNDLLDGEKMWDVKKETKLLPFTALAGQVVDDTISETLVRFHQTERWEPDLQVLAAGILRQYINFSIRWTEAIRDRQKWPKGDAVQPIDRWFWSEVPGDAEQQELRDRIRFCIDNFTSSKMPDFIRGFPVAHWHCPARTMEMPPHWFMVGDTPIYAKYDFMISSPGRTVIIDWKTGSEGWGASSAIEQLHWYAVYAHEDLGVPFEEIALIPMWLSSGPEWTEHTVSLDTVERLRKEWVERHRTLKEKVEEVGASFARLDEVFPLLDNAKTCRRCQFRSCNGYRRAAGFQAAPDAFELELDS